MWNEFPKTPISKQAENSHARNVPYQELITIESSWFHLCMGENWIPNVEWQIIPQMLNQPLASKTFCLQKFCSFAHM
jgi:hypothetical protein